MLKKKNRNIEFWEGRFASYQQNIVFIGKNKVFGTKYRVPAQFGAMGNVWYLSLNKCRLVLVQ